MFAFIAYGLVALIWSTTPLAIQWSSTDFSYSAAASLRMAIALVLASLVMALLRRPLRLERKALAAYLVASIGIFPNMPLVYWSAQFIPSGLIALIFGVLPFVTAGISFLVFKENPFNGRRVLALLVAIAGLGLICLDQLQLGVDALYGVCGMLLSNVIFASCSLWLKQLGEEMDALSQTTGALLFSLPGLVLCWWLLDGSVPDAVGVRSMVGVGYLAVMGSLLGFTLYYFVLKAFAVETVSLISLLSPVFALAIGAWFEGEVVTPRLKLGAALVIGALVLYQGNLYVARIKQLSSGFRRRRFTLNQPVAPVAASREESG